MRETWVQSLGWEDPLEKGTATHSSILAWRILWTEETGELQSMGSQRGATFISHYNLYQVILPPPSDQIVQGRNLKIQANLKFEEHMPYIYGCDNMMPDQKSKLQSTSFRGWGHKLMNTFPYFKFKYIHSKWVRGGESFCVGLFLTVYSHQFYLDFF